MNEEIINPRKSIFEQIRHIDENDVPTNVPTNLTEREKKLLQLIKADSKVSMQRLATLLQVNEKTIKRDVAKLKEMHILSRQGANKNGVWIINE